MLDDFNNQKSHSFPKEPQKFGNMTLFMKQGVLVLHVRTHAYGCMRSGQMVKDVMDYYLNYKEIQTSKFSKLAEMQLSHIEHCSKHIGKSVKIDPDRRSEMVRRIALDMAQRWADNCDDDHNLSPEFCENAKKLGEALKQRFEAGTTTMTIYESHSSGFEVAKNLRLIA